MKGGSGKLITWLVALLPVAVAATGIAVSYGCCSGRWPAEGTLSAVDCRQIALAAVSAVAAVSVLLAYRVYTLLNRYREQIRIRENALREFNAAIEARVDEEVHRQRRQDKMLIHHAKTAAMGEMVGLIDHRWRVPLRRLAGAGHHDERAGDAPDRSETDRGETAQTLEAMLRTLDEFRTLFRSDSAREQVDLSESVAQTLSLLEGELTEHAVTVETQLECAMTLPLHRYEIIQVLMSVIRNAKEALVVRRVELPRIEIECYETGQFIVIRICDNGGGVDASIEDRIFEPYFTTKKEERAAGLGLYTARMIVEEHCNGELTFDNLGEGACFYIKIGKHQEEAES